MTDWRQVLTWTDVSPEGITAQTRQVPIDTWVATATVERDALYRCDAMGTPEIVIDMVWARLKQRLQDKLDETGFVVEGEVTIRTDEEPTTGQLRCSMKARIRDDWDSQRSAWTSVVAAVRQDEEDRQRAVSSA